MPDSSDPVQAPRDREKAISAAYLRLLGESQPRAAKTAGIGERTLRNYESCSWWPEIQHVAADRWLSGLMAKARKGLEDGVKDDGRLALSVLERLDERLRPLPTRSEVSGPQGGPIEVEEMTREEIEERKAHLANRIAALQHSTNGQRNGSG